MQAIFAINILQIAPAYTTNQTKVVIGQAWESSKIVHRSDSLRPIPPNTSRHPTESHDVLFGLSGIEREPHNSLALLENTVILGHADVDSFLLAVTRSQTQGMQYPWLDVIFVLYLFPVFHEELSCTDLRLPAPPVISHGGGSR